ncbi:DUF6268 family outer membrane beta-barrel protein [Phocaeicola sp.]
MRKFITLLFLVIVGTSLAWSQKIESYTDYFSNSNFTDHANDFHDKEHGAGYSIRYGIKYFQPLSIKLNERNQPTVWSISAGLSMVRSGNSGEISTVVPRDILNFGAMASYIRPIAPKWSLAFSLGCGIYSQPGEIGFNSILASGGGIIIYDINPSLSVGLGIGLTNSFGIPMVMPTGYLKWVVKKKFELDVNLTNQVRVTASSLFGKRLRLAWNIVELDAMTAVVKHDGKDKLYSSMMLNSYFTPSLKIVSKFSVYANIGINIIRFSSISERKIKYMFSGKNLAERRQFSPALQAGIGLRYGF